jgi:uncharacterized membrane protein YphA (DoxX/SURF4 family)
MKKFLSNSYFLFLVRFFLGFVFIYAAVEKINDPGSFAVSISNYKLLPLFIVNIFAIIIPWIELAAGMLLVFGIFGRESSFIIGVLLVIFIAAISISLMRGLDINCGCFGTIGGPKIGFQKIMENVFLLLLSINLFYSGSGNFTMLQFKNKDKI